MRQVIDQQTTGCTGGSMISMTVRWMLDGWMDQVQMQQEEAERQRQVEEHQLRVQHSQELSAVFARCERRRWHGSVVNFVGSWR